MSKEEMLSLCRCMKGKTAKICKGRGVSITQETLIMAYNPNIQRYIFPGCERCEHIRKHTDHGWKACSGWKEVGA